MSKTEAERTIAVQRILLQAEEIAHKVGDSVVAVWCDNINGVRTLIGTAFFVEREGRTFLVTALHNFTNNEGLMLKIEFSSIIWTLNEMTTRISVDDDLWVGETSTDLHQLLQSIVVPLLKRDDPQLCRYGTGAVLMGYPEDLNLQSSPFKHLAISTTLEYRELTTTSLLVEPIVYHVNDDRLTTADGSTAMFRPDIYGMSGGAVFGWYYISIPENPKVAMYYFLQGMIVSWQRRDGYVVACNAARIAALAADF